MNKYNLIYVLILIGVLGCDNDQFIHPNTQFFFNLEANTVTINLDSTYQLYDNEISALFNGSRKVKLENISSEIMDMQFLDIQTAIVGKRHIYLVSEGINSVFVFNMEGELLSRVGREGKGPGEFIKIKSIAINESSGFLYVLENNEVEVFEYTGKNYKHLKTKILTHVSNYDICSMDNKVYLAGIDLETDQSENILTPSNLIKVYNQSLDSVLTTFGKTYQSYSKNPVLDALLSKGKLVCNQEKGTLTYIFTDYGYVLEFEKNGRLKDIYKFKGFTPRKVEEINIHQPENAGITYLDSDKINVFASAISHKNYRVYQIGNMQIAKNLEEVINSNKQAENSKPKPLNIIIDTEEKEIYSTEDIDYRILSINDKGMLFVEYNKISEGIYEPTVYLQKKK